MHFKNGRLAVNGDAVLFKDWSGKVVCGTIFNLRGGETCNCDVAAIIPGGVLQMTCQTIGGMYHAEDGFAALESVPTAAVRQPPIVQADAPVVAACKVCNGSGVVALEGYIDPQRCINCSGKGIEPSAVSTS